MLNDEKIGKMVSTEIAQFGEQTVKEYLEIVNRKGRWRGDEMKWEKLDDEADCVAVLEMLKSVGVIFNTKFVE